MQSLQAKQAKKATKVTLSVQVTPEIIDGLNEVKWRYRKSRAAVVAELLQNGIAEKLRNSNANAEVRND